MTTNTQRGRLWVFTDFGNDGEFADYSKFVDDRTVRAVAYGTETCPTTGKVHRQAFIQFNRAQRMSKIHNLVGNKCHCEIMRGDIKDNETYCSKESELVKYGDFVSMGKRSDLGAMKRMIDEGKTDVEVADAHFGSWIRYHSGLAKYRALIEKKRRTWRDVEVVYLYGRTGVGKTRTVMANGYDKVFAYLHSSPNYPFTGYEGEPILLIDEFHGQIKYSELLRILDGHPYVGRALYGTVEAKWTKVYICSNIKPGQCYKNIDDLSAWERRVRACHEVTEGNTGAVTAPLQSPFARDNDFNNVSAYN